jgi:hypothetical protein
MLSGRIIALGTILARGIHKKDDLLIESGAAYVGLLKIGNDQRRTMHESTFECMYSIPLKQVKHLISGIIQSQLAQVHTDRWGWGRGGGGLGNLTTSPTKTQLQFNILGPISSTK